MVARTQITVICDRCGKEGRENDGSIEKHTFSMDGEAVETELCTACKAKVLKVLQPVLEAEGGRRFRLPKALLKAS